jgi:DNA processing protein
LVSEQPFGAPAIAQNLIRRNHLQSGMALATVPFQTDLIGGTLHTVRFALLQGRAIFVPVPRRVHAPEPKSRGILALPRTGPEFAEMVHTEGAYKTLLHKQRGPVAIPIRSIRQILEALERLAPPVTPTTGTQLSLYE